MYKTYSEIKSSELDFQRKTMPIETCRKSLQNMGKLLQEFYPNNLVTYVAMTNKPTEKVFLLSVNYFLHEKRQNY